MHLNWLSKDILPAIVMTSIYVIIVKTLNIDFSIYSRIEIFAILIVLGMILLICNILIYKDIRDLFFKNIIKVRSLWSRKK